ncbi:MAG: sigma-70 family RNA polymerase sigma factor [Marmoricola sp.]
MLLTRLRDGDEASFAAIVVAWSPAMISLARRFVSSREAAEDAVQNTWLAVVAGIDRFEGRSGLRTWVLSILIRQAQQTGRREHRSIPFSSAWHDERQATVDAGRFRPPESPDHPRGWAAPLPRWDLLPDNQVQAAELRKVLAQAIGELPRRQQQVVVARDVWGCGSTEVCVMLHLSANYQRVLLHRARAHLRRALELYLVETVP